MPRPTLLPLTLLLLILAACSPKGDKQAGPPGGGGMPPPEVEVVIVGPRTVPNTLDVPGRMQAVRTAEVRARVEGILEKRIFREGGEIKVGDSLFRIDSRTLEANLESAQAALSKAVAQALLAGQNLERKKGLVAANAISHQDFDQSVALKSQSDAEVEAAKAALNRAQIDLTYANVTAPISGRIGRALVTEGALVGKGEATHLATIEQYDPIRVDFALSSMDFLKLREAQKSGQSMASKAPVRLILEDGQEYAQPGKVLVNDLAVDPATGSIGIRAEFPNPARELLPGQFVTVRLPTTLAKDVIVVPQRAVQASPQGQIVMVVGKGGVVSAQPVKTGGLSGSDWIISEGLKGGEQVIINGLQKARPGTPVTPTPVNGVTPQAAPTKQGGQT